MNLPIEILSSIALLLPHAEAARLRTVSPQFSTLFRDDHFWSAKAYRDVGYPITRFLSSPYSDLHSPYRKYLIILKSSQARGKMVGRLHMKGHPFMTEALLHYHPPLDIHLTGCCRLGRTDSVGLFLKDERVNGWLRNHTDSLVVAINGNHREIIEMLIGNPNFSPRTMSLAFIHSVRRGDLTLAKRLATDPRVDPGYRQKEALISAINKQDLEMVKWLLTVPGVDPSVGPGVGPGEHFNMPLISVIKSKNLLLLELLLSDPRTDPSHGGNLAVIEASHLDSPNMVERLLRDPRVDPSAHGNRAISAAVSWGRIENVRVLMSHPAVDPSVRQNEIIIDAISRGYFLMAQLLLQDPRVDPFDQNYRAYKLSAQRGHIPSLEFLTQEHHRRHRRPIPIEVRGLPAEMSGFPIFLELINQIIQGADRPAG